MADRFASIVKLFARVLAQPGANTQETALVIGALAALVLAIVTAVWLIFTPKTRKIVKTVYYRRDAYFDPDEGSEDSRDGRESAASGPEEAADDSAAGEAPVEGAVAPAPRRKPRRPLPGWLGWVIGPALVPLLLIAVLIGTYVASSTDDFCARSCHRGQPSVAAAEKVAHASCVDCHARPGLAGVAGNVSDRLRMIALWSGGKRTASVSAIVKPRSCLRCHSDVESRIQESTSANVRMKHAEPLASGMSCFVCHGEVGHLEKRQAVSMSRCVRCHDGERASAGCDSCHTGDIGSTAKPAKSGTVGSGKYSYPPVRVSAIGCGGCHDEAKECDTCHTTRMPHSPAFLSGYHAREAAFEQKERCWRCHVEGDCGSCHLVPFAAGHNPRWKSEHKASAADSACTCHQRGQSLPAGQMCRYCHGPTPQ